MSTGEEQKQLKNHKNNCSSVANRSSISGCQVVVCGMLQCKACGTAVVGQNNRHEGEMRTAGDNSGQRKGITFI